MGRGPGTAGRRRERGALRGHPGGWRESRRSAGGPRRGPSGPALLGAPRGMSERVRSSVLEERPRGHGEMEQPSCPGGGRAAGLRGTAGQWPLGAGQGRGPPRPGAGKPCVPRACLGTRVSMRCVTLTNTHAFKTAGGRGSPGTDLQVGLGPEDRLYLGPSSYLGQALGRRVPRRRRLCRGPLCGPGSCGVPGSRGF